MESTAVGQNGVNGAAAVRLAAEESNPDHGRAPIRLRAMAGLPAKESVTIQDLATYIHVSVRNRFLSSKLS